MLTTLQQLAGRLLPRLPYPLALQSLISLVLLATLPSALAEPAPGVSPRFALLCALTGLHLAACWLVPARRISLWSQLAFLWAQVGTVALEHVVMPSQMSGYVYLAIVLQAVYLFKPLLWIGFAAGVYAIWSGSLMIASASLRDWILENLSLAFPVLCIVVAAGLYARQHRRREQVQQALQQMQSRYEALRQHLSDAPQHAALEERRRLSQTIADDLTIALAQIEQNIASALGQAQTNLARLETTIAQTRAAAAAAIDRMRAAVSSLRLGARDEQAPELPAQALALPPDELMTVRSQRALTWSLPLAFAAVALPLALLERSVTPTLAALFVACCALLIGGYVLTERLRNPLLVQLGLVGQAAAVLGIVFVTQALPLLLGLLLVMWQIALRLSGSQIVAFLIGVQTAVGLALARVLPLPELDSTQLLIFGVACAAVVGLVGPARRELARRRMIEARLAQLASAAGELERQLAQVRALAVGLERTRLAREIHDDLGHRLVLLNVQLQLVDDLIEEDAHAALEQLESTREQLREAWSGVLQTADARLALDGAGLAAALDRLVGHWRTLTCMRVSLRTIGDLTCFDPAAACAAYRAVQEGLTNACKYAQARQLDVLVYCDDVVGQVRVRDDGSGGADVAPSPCIAEASGHFGLVGLRERAEQLGGSVEAGPLPEGGFELSMTIPLR